MPLHWGWSLLMTGVLGSLAGSALAQGARQPGRPVVEHSSSGRRDTVLVSEKQNGETIDLVVGQKLTVVLPAHMGTGYVWRPQEYPTRVLKPLGNPKGVLNPEGRPVAPGGTEPFYFYYVAAAKSDPFVLGFQETRLGVDKPRQKFAINVRVTGQRSVSRSQ